MFCPRFTPVVAIADGRVVDVGDSIGPATGRFVTLDLDDGNRARFLHLDSRFVGRGDRVKRGQVIALSGATGYGEEDWSWNVWETGGAHVHMTLWLTQRYIFGANGTVDPEPYFDPEGSTAGTDATRVPTEEEELMSASQTIIDTLGPRIDAAGKQLKDRRDVALMWVNGDCWVCDYPSRTRWNAAAGQATVEDTFLFIDKVLVEGLGWSEHENQSPIVIAALRDITDEGSVRDEVAKALRNARG